MSSPAVTGKRKRAQDNEPSGGPTTVIQFVTGSYERVLHGFTIQIPQGAREKPDRGSHVAFEDTFLFTAHASSIRSLAVSPASTPKHTQAPQRILATGSTDERINLYHISSSANSVPPTIPSSSLVPRSTPSGSPGTATPKNRELGSLLHHSSAVTTLHFPSRSKLLSASSDNSIAITRVRDWTVLSTIRAPVPKAVGRPSGDTSALGDFPAGIIDVAVHPSTKLCVSIGHGEKCMRLWNLVTGKRAGVLAFDKGALAQVGEGKWRAGEARRVVWDDLGEEFAVAFERGCIVYSLDCQIKAVVPVSTTKVCQVRYLPADTTHFTGEDLPVEEHNHSAKKEAVHHRTSTLVLSTEDGRVMFYDTSKTAQETTPGAVPPKEPAVTSTNGADQKHAPKLFPVAYPLAMLTPADTPSEPRRSRVKDFEIFRLEDAESEAGDNPVFFLATATSTGTIRVCTFRLAALERPEPISAPKPAADTAAASRAKKQKTAIDATSDAVSPASAKAMTAGDAALVGIELGVYETGNRIVCMTGFLMDVVSADASASREEESVAGQGRKWPSGDVFTSTKPLEGHGAKWTGLNGNESHRQPSPNVGKATARKIRKSK